MKFKAIELVGTEADQIRSRSIENHMGCWIWTGHRTNTGYGYLFTNKTKYLVHRVSYTVFNGPIPEGMLIRHRCHNSLCCNPLHLEPGTDRDNWLDMLVDGHTRLLEQSGSDNHASKLSEQQVYDIRTEFAKGIKSANEIAKDFGITRRTVERTVNGELNSCYTEVPPYEWRDLPVDSFLGRLTKQGQRRVKELYASGERIAEIVRITGLSKKLVHNAVHRNYVNL